MQHSDPFHRFCIFVWPSVSLKAAMELATSLEDWRQWGGEIYIHFDGNIKDFAGIYSKDDPFFREGLAAELRYIIDNGLVDKDKVKFFVGSNPLTGNLKKLLEFAIRERKRLVIEKPEVFENHTQKGNYNIKYD